MFVRIPAARRPEIQFEMMLPACQIPMRSGDSSLVYHELVMRDTAGRKGPSVTPTRKRQSMKDQPLFIPGIEIVTADQLSIQAGNNQRGLPLAMITFAGTYRTKDTSQQNVSHISEFVISYLGDNVANIEQ